MLANTTMDYLKVQGNTNGLINLLILGNLSKALNMVVVSGDDTLKKTKDAISMKVNITKIKSMELVFLNGSQEIHTKANTRMTKGMALEL